MLAATAVLFFAVGALADKAADEVLAVPNFNGSLCFKNYAGYLPTTAPGHNLFYWFHEATSAPADKPLLLWLNGGPGCSSLGGMFVEHGPFVLDADLSVSLNPYSWNVAANVLYLEQPAGVGFSYGAAAANDTTTAAGSVDALEQFLARFPEYGGRPFYIAGESYGGHYVPNIAREIQDRQQAGSGALAGLNLKGFAVGNGYTDWALDFSANVHYGVGHALTSREDFAAADAACAGDFARCFWPRDDVTCPAACDAAVSTATAGAMDGSIDIYDIYEDVCLDGAQQARAPTAAFTMLQERQRGLQGLRARRTKAQQQRLGGTTISPIFPTCIDQYNVAYLNLPEVQAAIHVRPGTVPGKGGVWSDCGNVDYDFNYASELPNYKHWIADKSLDILIYSGDADFIVNFMGSENWITSLNLTVAEPWQKWKGADKQVAGFFIEYDGLTFLTVKGAGHMVPKDRPLHALNMLTSFLGGTPFNKVAPAASTPPLCAASSSN
jgi:cathepsin A (carboxypeptidase C)/serine carboxypeptidase-like clade 2